MATTTTPESSGAPRLDRPDRERVGRRRPSLTQSLDALLPYLVLVGTTIAAVAWVTAAGRAVDGNYFYAVLQYSATIGPIALGFGLAMLAGHFDLSVSSMFGFAGITAIMLGQSSWALGLVAALAVAAAVGLVQGLIVVRLGAPSLPVTLGGLVTLSGLSYVVTGSRSVTFDDYEIGVALGQPIAGIFSARSIAVLACFAVAGALLSRTRLGRDLYATGSNPGAARSVGLRVSALTIGILVVSAILTAGSGAMVAFTLAAASPDTATNPLIPAVVAAIIGGVSVSGGAGTAQGILAGVLTLSVVKTTFNVVAAPQFVTEVTYGLLLAVAMLAASPEKGKLLGVWRARTAQRQKA
jgi:ribose/xylose/arabinose/galactoside ABC-type transport system permease subunit